MEKTQREIAEDWLKFTIENWRNELRRLKIKNSNDLFNSFHGNVVAGANGDVTKVAIAYAWYGQMVDMGVGRGTKNGEQVENIIVRRALGKKAGRLRKAKPWYTKGRNGIGYQTYQLAQLLGKSTATETVKKITDSISLNHIIDLK